MGILSNVIKKFTQFNQYTRSIVTPIENKPVSRIILPTETTVIKIERTLDQRSITNINTLLPEAKLKATTFLNACIDNGMSLKIICGTRTYEEQNAIYSQGRTKPGKIVTNARGGYSWHNFGIAWDIGIFSEDGKSYIPESPLYKKAGVIGRSLGLDWGGDWKFVDEPHFQLKIGLTLEQCRDRVKSGIPII